jgi:predicted nucleic acid-binding protein
MTADADPVFLDANVLIYSLDETSQPYGQAVGTLQRLLEEGAELCTSHHVIEEVLHITQKLATSTTVSEVVDEISKIPDLIMVEPAAEIEFAKRYAALSERLNMGINDALLLQLLIDSGIRRLFSYDKKLVSKSRSLGIESIAGQFEF